MSTESKNKTCYPCRICGYCYSSPVRYEDGAPSYEICPSCGGEVGIDDEGLDKNSELETIRNYRNKWLAQGAPWWDPYSQPPEGWNVEEQMKNIPPEYL